MKNYKEKGGIIKVPSNMLLKFEKFNEKSLLREFNFERDDVIYICNTKNRYALVDKSKKLIKTMR